MVTSPKIEYSNDIIKHPRDTFSFFFFTWAIFTLYLGVFLYYLAYNLIPYGNQYFTIYQTLILQLLLITFSQYIVFLFIFEIVPFSAIDFSFSAMKQFLLHKLLFIFTTPILLIEFFVLNFFLNPIFASESEKFTFMLIISIIPIIVWIIITSWVWEVFNGKNSSKFLSNIRVKNVIMNSPEFIISLGKKPLPKVTELDYQRRWLVIALIASLLIFNIIDFLNNIFLATFIFLFSDNLLLFLLVHRQYLFSLNRNGYQCTSIKVVYSKVFGYSDLSKNITLYSVLAVFLLFILGSLNHNKMVVGIFFILEILIFLLILFSNQLKRSLGMKEQSIFEEIADGGYISMDEIKW